MPDRPEPGGPRPASRASCWPRARARGCARRCRRCCTRSAGAACSATPCTRSPRSSPSTSSSSSGTARDQVRRRGRRAGRASWAARCVAAVQEQQLGTGHAVRCALDALPADLTGAGGRHLRRRAAARAGHAGRAAGRAHRRRRRGHAAHQRARRPHRLRPGAARRRTAPSPRIVEQADATPEQRAVREVNSGVYAFDAALPRRRRSAGWRTDQRAGRALPDRPGRDRPRRRAGRCAACAAPTTGRSQGSTTGCSWPQVRAELNRRLLRALDARRGHRRRPGHAPGSTSQVRLEPRRRAAPGHPAARRARSVGDGAEIGPDTTLTDCEVGAGATVVRTHGSEAPIGPGASVGPFAYLRPGARLGEHGKIGTFVEVKNADIGAGTQGAAPHLRRRRDDRRAQQHRRVLGVRQLRRGAQAPHGRRLARADRLGQHVRRAACSVGDGAYTGAGTVLREDVPPGALAVSAGSQRTIEGWVERKRPGTPAAEAAGRYRSAGLVRRRTRRRPRRHTHGELDVGDPEEEPDALLRAGRTPSWPSRWPSTSTSRSPRSRPTPSPTARSSSGSRSRSAAATRSSCSRTRAPINDQIMEQLIMVDALKRASAKRITVVMPFWGYSRQDKKHRGREPISARLIADMFKTAGADRIMTVDLHTAQIQGFFDGPVDHLFALPVLAEHIKRTYAGARAGRRLPRLRPRPAGRALGRHPRRHPAGVHPQDPRPAPAQRGRRQPGGRRGRGPALRGHRRHDRHRWHGGEGRRGRCSREGASDVIVAATHGVLSGPARERLASCGAREVIFTDTLPIPDEKRFPQHDGAVHRPAAGPRDPRGVRRRLGDQPVRRQRLSSS